MFISEEYKEIVEKKYVEAKEAGIDTITLDEKTLGGLTLFIGAKPAFSLGTFIMEDGASVYIGAQLLTKASS
ncbi:hypothetical protein IT401_00645 [Candidatus Nomurabacteria bacterium]|nr:hypothetical protein [Candidatus Nomurabacteria bacterium]